MKLSNPILDKLFVLFWTLWCSLVFVVALIIVFPILVIGVNIPSKGVYRAMHFAPVIFSKIVLVLMGIKVKVHNMELLDAKKQYILVGNHMSYLDALISAVASNNYKKFIGKAEILRYPVLGYLLKKLYVPVQRDQKESRKWSMETMFKYLKDGASMVIFPEGTCNTTSELLKEFKDGAFSLSVQLQIPIAVCTIVGAADLMPRKLLSLRPGSIDVYWTKIIDPKEFNMEQLEQMKTLAKAEMLPILEKVYPNGYSYPY
ncbi:MAG: 1-acyl-sn-glycerol-3-phosphate acyltransferase [Chitinophagales bacterium]|nr:1-acyl-sn-glycerol-3-phosphate acyltransferase [Chitinophagales bacterium]